MNTEIKRMKLTHQDSSSQECNKCNRSFGTYRQLQNHKRVHDLDMDIETIQEAPVVPVPSVPSPIDEGIYHYP
ncbi:hypothetical protein BD770DRAFT_403892 [Pilaira anomala]|nr:hypothetical protein BD770DRAFT_404598 [Pilaira anomala]KAI9330339.1 hypothetical protein BD770DRAFT_403892 [Pilaira anomala]